MDIIARKYFYPVVPFFDCYKGRFRADDILVAQSIAERVMTLPLYADIPIKVVDEICDIIVTGV